MFRYRRLGRNDGDLAGHAEVNEQRELFRWVVAAGQIDEQVFTQAANLQDGGAG